MSNLTKIMYPNNRKEDQYEELLSQIKTHFHEISEEKDLWLYKTDATDLFQVFLDNLPEDAVQHYTCNTCRKFVNKYGSLVSITSDGEIIPVMWPETGAGIFADAVAAVRKYLTTKAKVVAVFYTDRTTLGVPNTGEWYHMSVQLHRRFYSKRYAGMYGSASEMICASMNDYVTVCNALKEYDGIVVGEALKLIKSGVLFRSDKIENICTKFLNLINDIKGEIPSVKRNKIWYYIANASDAGCLHIRSSVIGTILDDINNGVGMDTIIKKFNDKMDPMHYQRPQAAPSIGNIERAEQLFKELGFTDKSLKRRFASVDDLETVWKPCVCEEDDMEEYSVFGRLKDQAKNTPKISKMDGTVVKRGIMTWNRFYKEILPHARRLRVINANIIPTYIFATFLTAVYPEDKCIFRYGNHASYYMYNNSGMPISFNRGDDTEVIAISYDPELWGRKDDMINGDTAGITLILKDAKDNYRVDGRKIPGTAIFPEDLIPEFREIRSTIAMYSATDYIQDAGVGYATGIRIQRGIVYHSGIKLIVETDTMGTLSVNIDRWE